VTDAATDEGPTYSLWDLVWYATKLGSVGFGGPVALVGYMHRDLVERRQWISESDFKEGLTLAQLMPGPLAAQLAIYLGYVHYRITGATLVGIAFVLPPFSWWSRWAWPIRPTAGSSGCRRCSTGWARRSSASSPSARTSLRPRA